MAVDEIGLPGAHNRLNAMAAAAVTLARGVEPDAVARRPARPSPASRTGSSSVATVDGVAYVNDSKATNIDAAVTGLASFAGGAST